MRKILSLGAIAVLFVGVASVGVNAAPNERRQPADRNIPVITREPQVEGLERLERMTDRLSVDVNAEFEAFSRVNCRDLACLNRELTQLARFANGTAKRLSTLDAFAREQSRMWRAWYQEWNTCVPVMPITAYGDPAGSFGYLWTPDQTSTFPTTALDITLQGDEVSAYALVWACDVTS